MLMRIRHTDGMQRIELGWNHELSALVPYGMQCAFLRSIEHH
ncbi:hypothetical protein [Paenibacillus sp. N3.4]|nr:hypothetical protein [Paenibacillus sp. N3.4]